MTRRGGPERGVAGLRQLQHRPGEYREAHDRGEGEDCFPAKQRVEHASDERRDHRHQHHDRGDQPDHRGCVLAVVEIADDRPTDGLSGRGAERLRNSRDDETCNARGEHGGRAGDGRQRESREHHRAAAETVGQRPEHELRRGQSHEIERDRKLHAGRIGRELGRQSGDRRHQDVERQRAHPRHRDQQRQ